MKKIKVLSSFMVFLVIVSILPLGSFASIKFPDLSPNIKFEEEIEIGSVAELIAINSKTNKIYIANRKYDERKKLTVIDVNNSNSIAKVNIGGDPLKILINKATNKIYVYYFIDKNSTGICVVDGNNNSVTTIKNGIQPISDLVVNETTNKIYAAVGGSGNLMVINGKDNSTFSLNVGSNAESIALNLITNKIYITNLNSNVVAIINGFDDSVSKINIEESTIHKLAINEKTNKIYITNEKNSNLIIVDGNDNSTKSIHIGLISKGRAYDSNPVSVNPITNKIYVVTHEGTNSNYLNIIDGVKNTIISKIKVVEGEYVSSYIKINPNTNKVYVLNYDGSIYNTTHIIDGTNDTIENLDKNNYYNVSRFFGIAINPSINKIYFIDDGTGSIFVFKDDSPIMELKPTNMISSEGFEVTPLNERLELCKINADSVGSFSGGLASAIKDGKCGYINKAGKWVIEPQFDVASKDFKNGLAAVRIDGKPEFGSIYTDDTGKLAYNGKWGYIDKSGKWAIKPTFSYAKDFSEGLALVVCEDGSRAYIDKSGRIKIQGKIITDIVNELFGNDDIFSNGLAVIKTKSDENSYKYGYIDKSGEIIVEPKFDSASPFSEGLAAVKKDRKWGFIDTTGKFVISATFDDAKSFSEGLAFVGIRDKYGYNGGYIDKSGNYIIYPQSLFSFPVSFSEGLIPVKKDGKWGFVDKSGISVIDLTFDSAWEFKEGIAAVKVLNQNSEAHLAFIDRSNWILFEFKDSMELMGLFKEGFASVKNSSGSNRYVGFIRNKYYFKPLEVIIDDEILNIDVVPSIVNDRILVPLRAIFEKLGATVEWNGKTKTIIASKGTDTTIELQIDNKIAKVNGKEILLEVPPIITKSRTLVPLRFVSESLGASVEWDGENRTAIIKSNP